ncbi:NADH-dependent flavin oxidoreductase [Mycoplasma phocoenae]|uniref:NADH-dependent flavin oxidoreductase n=1 Tax=Mycoplasma phocoenae TaxID=754517 RepID=A0A858U5G1_9MOLU|nr:NADH-dependent flavin oxidoreductase [Mycoplasma phocoenae]QJG67281.1 NADH-dependent flavin oxidoreductase [Mycoplasma phocoenae]
MNKYNPLFQKIKLKNHILDNRFVLSPMTLNLATKNGKMTKEEIDYALRRSHSATLQISGGAYFDDFGHLFEYGYSAKDDDDIESLAKLANAMKARGSVAILQLAHAGKWSVASIKEHGYVYGPSYEHLHTPIEHDVFELSIEQIKQIVTDYGKATIRAIKAGFDGVEISMAQRLLLQTFISKLVNKRTDEYGCQSLENRSRLLLEVITEIQRVIDDYADDNFIFGFRATPEETVGSEIGYTIEEFNSIMDLILNTANISYLAIASWGHDIYLNKVRSSEKYKNQLVNKVVYEHINKRIPIISSGGINTPEKCLEALEYSDLVGLSSVFVVEPEFAQKLKNNKPEEINLKLTTDRLDDLKIPSNTFKNIVRMFDYGETIPDETRQLLTKNSKKQY